LCNPENDIIKIRLIQYDNSNYPSEMSLRNKLQLVLILLVLVTLFLSCKTSINPDDETSVVTITNNNVDTIPDSLKGVLVFHENFQKWPREGYLSSTSQNCETDLMRSAGLVSFFTTPITVKYDTLTVSYAMIDFAINPVCGNPDESSTDSSEVSNGYVALQCPVYYTCGHYSKGYFETSSLPSVSYVEFTVSYPYSSSNTYAAGVSLWKKGDGDVDSVQVGTYVPSDPLKGQKFTVAINSTNVTLRFKSEKNPLVPMINESDENHAIRIHDLYIWQPKKN